MNLKESLIAGINLLKSYDIEFPAKEAGIILAFVLNKSISYLYTNSDENIEKSSFNKYINLVKLRSENMPIQYIVGYQEFMSLNFFVSRDVLIPRPETELIVEKVIELSGEIKSPIKVLDIGTGSGCIAVSIAHFVKNVEVTAIDISEKALDIARKNARNNKVNNKIFFKKSDLFSELEDDKFDFIVSNPPYINDDDIGKLDKIVKDYEPMIALKGGLDGLDFYRSIIKDSKKFLKVKGFVVFEIGYNQEHLVENILKENDYYTISKYKDLCNIVRIIMAN